MFYKKIIMEKVEKIYQILNELQCNEIELFLSIQRNQNVLIKKINKLEEYNEIDDMSKALMDKRLLEIKQMIKS